MNITIVKLTITVLLFGFTLACSEKQELYQFKPISHAQTQWGSLEAAIATPNKINGMIEVSQYANKAQTKEQKFAADQLHKQALDNAIKRGWFDINFGLADGYVFDPKNDTLHFPKPEFIVDGKTLNPLEPEVLMYYKTSQGMLLAGIMFTLIDDHTRGEQIGGPETVWHYHHYDSLYCVTPMAALDAKYALVYEKGRCEEGYEMPKSPEMMHLWFIDHPEGRFSSAMAIDVEIVAASELAVSEKIKARKMWEQKKGP